MNTKKVKNNVVTKGRSSVPKQTGQKALATAAQEPDPLPVNLPISSIEISPLNYRKYYDPTALAEFAAAIKELGFIISPVTVRPIGKNRYQLVVGERRYHGAKLAGLKELPCIVRVLSDEQVEDIQMQENTQREDPHPMHEAIGVHRMYLRGMGTEEIATRLGKSASWVFRREKLSSLVPDFQEMFLANMLTATAALEIADLAPEGQQSFFDNYCRSWKERRITLSNVSGYLSSYRYDLSNVIFDITEPNLLPSCGACTSCRFNTAYKGLLLPETDAAGKCTNKACFDQKKSAYVDRTIRHAFTDDQVVAIIVFGELPAYIRTIIDDFQGPDEILLYQEEKVTLIHPPKAPQEADFMEIDYPDEYDQGTDEEEPSEDEDEEPAEEEECEMVGVLNKEAFGEAQREYTADLDAYNMEISNGKCLKGLHITGRRLKVVYYYPVPSSRQVEKDAPVRLGDIEKLIRDRKDTPAILQSAINQINKREQDEQGRDIKKIHATIHSDLVSSTVNETVATSMTEEDRVTTLFLAYDTLIGPTKSLLEKRLNLKFDYHTPPEQVYAAFARLTEADAALLIRIAITGRSGSQLPTTAAGFFLVKVAEGAGVDTAAIEKKQHDKAQDRQEKQSERVYRFQKRLTRLQARTATSPQTIDEGKVEENRCNEQEDQTA